ncbi:shikimate dehydrogenase [Xinfangfangia sp. CPCC 101601]|uniref:shikimate dehydrogenase (NADP(+)) n=1 Tax=Pseudogemmobacter lacusdianii TaxID=3069608 RepID=A0ABU0W272_9RHOB|nr:shikimate dehydrogenase [Xinfangfangia sp. CPCC 101601]MDQ2068104.1 shikimate dehydrogenase [Xinfangfangia sp. CPCC 101601]
MINATTRLIAVAAYPVHHLRSPQALNAMFVQAGTNAVVVPCEVRPEDLASFIYGLRGVGNLSGLIVTVPHKAAAAALCDQLGPQAQAAGAVNVIRREVDGSLTGELLDGLGFVAGLAAHGHSVQDRRVWLQGAGGAASAIAFALAQSKVAALTLMNRSPDKLAALAERLRVHHPQLRVEIGGEIGAHDMVVNATSLGLKFDDPLPVEITAIASDALVVDIIMEPAETALLRAAKARGLPTHTGRAMLDGQLSEIITFLTKTG